MKIQEEMEREYRRRDTPYRISRRILERETPECVGTKHWWFWLLPSVMKCKRCGVLKRAER